MHKIRQSRVKGAKVICDAIAQLENKPAVYVSASGIGYYGDRGDEIVCEGQPCGDNFLAEVSRDREEVSNSLQKSGVRVVNTRFGMVLGKRGVLMKMLPPFRVGLGATFGSGKQYWSWVTIADAVGALIHVINDKSVSGPVNVVSPAPVTNVEFANTLARVLRKPQYLAIPAKLAAIIFGKLANELLLSSIRSQPKVLIDSGFVFKDTEIEKALRRIISK